ncbi:hypothetical protein FBALC1_00517 [Flavobacteriales bacterium ALC-1]|nr:hypothetical protein FBALC1_00517 [Flavobacteriales bacterium ALC-1]
MNDKKNIDRLFQEKFKDFEVAPNDAVWNRISESLPNQKKKRRVIPIWWQIGGVAAAIALLLTVGVSVFNSDGNNNKNLPIVNTDKTESVKDGDDLNSSTNSKQEDLKRVDDELKFVDSDTDNSLIKDKEESNTPKKDNASNQLTSPNNATLNSVANNSNSNTNKKEKKTSSQKRTNLTTSPHKDNRARIAANTKNSENSNKTKLANDSEIKSAIKNAVEENNTAVADNTTSSQNSDSETKGAETKNSDELEAKNSIVDVPEKQSIQDAIAEQTKTIDEKEEDKQNRWSIAPNVAPVYFGSLGEGSPINGQFNGNSKAGDINMSYGISGSYAVSDKLKIRAGVNRVNLNHVTSDVITFTGDEVLLRGENTDISNVEYIDGQHSISFMHANKYFLMSKPTNNDIKQAGNIDQRFGFIEVPLELEYRLLDKKFGINLIGGFSTFFLNDNEIYADIDGASTLIGEANNINSTSFSANLGFGIDYSLSEKWNINLEPTFKYQINTFNNTSGDFKPFFVGVYTGLSFKF